MANYPEMTTFAEFSQLAIEIDNRQYGYAMTRSGNKPSSAHSRPPTAHHAPVSTTALPPTVSAPTTTPMDMDLSQARHGPLPPSERIRRQKEGLCTYCGSADHWLEGCPKKPSKSPYRNASKAAATISALQSSPNEEDQHDVISFQL